MQSDDAIIYLQQLRVLSVELYLLDVDFLPTLLHLIPLLNSQTLLLLLPILRLHTRRSAATSGSIFLSMLATGWRVTLRAVVFVVGGGGGRGG